MIRKVLAAALLATGLLAVAATPAQAGTSDYAECIVTVDPTTFAAGATVAVTGTGLQPNFETTLEFNSVTVVVGTVMTDATGSFDTTVVIPADATAGAHTITAVCDSEGNISSTDVTISSDIVGTGDDGPLPTTGSDVEPLVIVGAVAILAGVAFVLVAKRRRTHTNA